MISLSGWVFGTWIRLLVLVLVITGIIIGVVVFHVQTYLIQLLVNCVKLLIFFILLHISIRFDSKGTKKKIFNYFIF
jgi:hypothetical protein